MNSSDRYNAMLDKADEYKYEAIQALSFGIDLYEEKYFSEAASKFLLSGLYYEMYKNLVEVAGADQGGYQELVYKVLGGTKSEEVAAMNAMSRVPAELTDIIIKIH